ncbi:UPF0033 family protein [Natronomonas moolapensis 8.8.11]|uniref:UPF0033 family protein n=1 Tax=Natronomonas moolapensis (strain DSM 18674 / CECT 7526 / JCM 14361 / 8.8.11) TaxID=268739 RepID=M1XTA3_NATM8|nr:sulfurtransferase TusA family protein [Natronomonas moolapensis]CCQ37628.1 UPF0033 family protein [Natronomonas moolapensis 8.8.11]
MTPQTELGADVTVDSRGAGCPGPLMGLVGEVHNAEQGAVVRLLSDNERSLGDVPGWAEEAGNDLAGVVDGKKHHGFYLEKV